MFYGSWIHVRSFKIIDRPEFEKTIIEKKVEKEVKHRIPYATRNINYIFHHSKEIFLTTSIKLFCKGEGCFILHLVKFRGNRLPSAGDKNCNDCHMACRMNTPEYYGKIISCDTGKGREYGHLFLQLS